MNPLCRRSPRQSESRDGHSRRNFAERCRGPLRAVGHTLGASQASDEGTPRNRSSKSREEGKACLLIAGTVQEGISKHCQCPDVAQHLRGIGKRAEFLQQDKTSPPSNSQIPRQLYRWSRAGSSVGYASMAFICPQGLVLSSCALYVTHCDCLSLPPLSCVTLPALHFISKGNS